MFGNRTRPLSSVFRAPRDVVEIILLVSDFVCAATAFRGGVGDLGSEGLAAQVTPNRHVIALDIAGLLQALAAQVSMGRRERDCRRETQLKHIRIE